MLLSRFKASAVHGFLDLEIDFRDRLTFLTGINGSGKTTVLNAIQALITPDLAMLQNLEFAEIRVDFRMDNGSAGFIAATQTENDIQVWTSKGPAPFSFARYKPDPTIPLSRQTEGEVEYFRDVLATSSGHPVIAFIESLATPMFLGLDRKVRLTSETRRIGVPARYWHAPARISRGELSTSLLAAESIMIEAYRDALLSAGRVGDQLQRQLILSLLTPSMAPQDEFAIPTPEDKRVLSSVKADLEQFPAIFKLPARELYNKIDPFLQKLETALASIPENADVHAYFQKNNSPPPYFDSLLTWGANRSQLKKIAVISQMVSSYNERQNEAIKPFENFKKLVNDFLEDSGKSIEIDEHGRYVVVKIDGVKGGKPLTSLSSGEAQIFVILTNLAFSPAAQKANVFIIDEPELSLHVRWQEKFVDSVLSANVNTQFIMATHSPSIILERTGNCIDVVTKKKRSRRG